MPPCRLRILTGHGAHIFRPGQPLVEQLPVPDSQDGCPQQIEKPDKKGGKGQKRGQREEIGQQAATAEGILIPFRASPVCPRDAHPQDELPQRSSPCQGGDKGVVEKGEEQRKPAVLCPFLLDQRKEYTVYNKDEKKVKAKGQQAPGQGDLLAPAQAGSVHVLPGGEKPHEGRRAQVSGSAAQGVAHQVIYVKEPVSSGIDKIQAAELSQLKEQGQEEGEEESPFKAAPKVVPQIDAKGHDHEEVVKHLEKGGVFDKREPGGRIPQAEGGLLKNVPYEHKGNRLHPGPCHLRHLVDGGEGQDDKEVDAQQVQDEGVHHKDAEAEHGAVLPVVVDDVWKGK